MNKTTKYFLFAGLFLFFAGTTVARAVDCDTKDPKCCDVTLNKSKWQFILIGPELVDESTLPDRLKGMCTFYDSDGTLVPDTDCYQYDYQAIPVSGAPINQMYFTFPYNYGPIPLYINGIEDVTEPGSEDGTATVDLGAYVQELFAGRIPPNSETGLYSFWSNISQLALSSIGATSKSEFGTCGILGPNPYFGYDPDEIYTLSSTECISTSDDNGYGYYKITRDDNTQCITEVRQCNDNTCVTCDPPYVWVDIEDAIKYIASDGTSIGAKWSGQTNQICNESIIKANPWVWISGRRVWRPY